MLTSFASDGNTTSFDRSLQWPPSLTRINVCYHKLDQELFEGLRTTDARAFLSLIRIPRMPWLDLALAGKRPCSRLTRGSCRAVNRSPGVGVMKLP